MCSVRACVFTLCRGNCVDGVVCCSGWLSSPSIEDNLFVVALYIKSQMCGSGVKLENSNYLVIVLCNLNPSNFRCWGVYKINQIKVLDCIESKASLKLK